MRPSANRTSRARRLDILSTLFIGAAVFFTAYFAITVTYKHAAATQYPPSKPSTARILLKGVPSKDSTECGKPETVVKEVIKEVPKEIVKEVIKEVPKEIVKEVIKEVPKEVVKEVVKEVPKVVEKVVIKGADDNPRLYHSVTTCQGFANHWQVRIHYYWFLKTKRECLKQPICDMGGFTRLLHSGQADDLMDEVPTVVVDKLPESMLKSTSYVVLNRPYAFMEWLNKTSIPEKYILMLESDHLFLRPLPNLMNGDSIGAFMFSYIVPWNFPNIVRKYTGPISDEELHKVPQIGNSPTFVSVADLRSLAPQWFNITLSIFGDEESYKAWNWVLEMYGFALATYNLGMHKQLKAYTSMLSHPPFDKTETDYQGTPFYLLHLTYPCRYNNTGRMTENETEVVWQFDKRRFGDKPPPLNMELPPPEVQKENVFMRKIVEMFNEATSNIPCWQDYYERKVVTRSCKQAQLPITAHAT